MITYYIIYILYYILHIIYLPQEVMILPLLVCLFIAQLSQSILDRFSWKFMQVLAIEKGPTNFILVEFGSKVNRYRI